MNHLRPKAPLHCVVAIDYAEAELRVAAAHAKKRAAQAELTDRALDAWFKVEPEKPTPSPKSKKAPLVTPRPDCGEAGHDEGRCGNASCGSAPTVVKSTNDKPEKRPLRPGDYVRRITDSARGEVKAGCVRKVDFIANHGAHYAFLGEPVAGIGRRGSVPLASEGKTWERVEWSSHFSTWVAA